MASWDILKTISRSKDLSWMVYGDFNEILYAFEKVGVPKEERWMAEFQEVLEACQLLNVGYSGTWFTWERGNLQKTNIRECLDGRIVYLEWRNMFPFVVIQHLLQSFSDHCPLL